MSILSQVLPVCCYEVLAIGSIKEVRDSSQHLQMPSGDTVVPGLVLPTLTPAISSGSLLASIEVFLKRAINNSQRIITVLSQILLKNSPCSKLEVSPGRYGSAG